MKFILSKLFDSRTTIILLILLIISLATATFIENSFDTATAMHWVYRAKWFELIFLLLIINLLGHINQYKLLSRKKWSGFTFHMAFVVIIIGAGVTRYFGFEGSMHIREGQSTNIMQSREPVLFISIPGNKETEIPYEFKTLQHKPLHIKSSPGDSNKYVLTVIDQIDHAIQEIHPTVSGGKEIISLQLSNSDGQKELKIESGNFQSIGPYSIGFNCKSPTTFAITSANNRASFISSEKVLMANTSMHTEDTIEAKETAIAQLDKLYGFKGNVLQIDSIYSNARLKWVSSGEPGTGSDIVLLQLKINDIEHEIAVSGGEGQLISTQTFFVDTHELQIGIGQKAIKLPFSLYLKKFELEHYPGSRSPSSYASEVLLIDDRKQLKEEHRIFMNNVLDYNQYRFFQTSYDQDEKGTLLTVSHDFYGTLITYAGYALLILGFLLTLFNRNSRFHFLAKRILELQIERKSVKGLFILLLVGLNQFGFGNNPQPGPVEKNHAQQFGELMTQTFDGRFEPINTLAYDVMHKIARKDAFHVDAKGDLNAMQVFMDIILFPDFWKDQKIIYVREKSVWKVLGIDNKYASYEDFFDQGNYKLQAFIDEAFRKKQSEQNTFDKEIIKVDERVNIYSMLTRGSLLNIFPDAADNTKKWINPTDKASLITPGPSVSFINEDLHLDMFNYRSLSIAYFSSVLSSLQTGDYSIPGKLLNYIKAIQVQTASPEIVISTSKIKAEVLYNELQVFIFLRNFYGGISIILLLLSFIESIKSRKSPLITWPLKILTVLLALGFIYHTFGMAMRWYLSGHAPWSNGYESLILVAWGSLLAGFAFMRYSKITLAATSLLAFFVLMTASHSSYDPQLTNLQPVLKSYWLIIHVATLTISYGFLGLGFILGIINLFILLFRNVRNKSRLDSIIHELTSINEMNLTIGIVLATVGTFLGGIWANESWGRYWGWDAKETWALIIVLVYTLILHLRFIPKLSGVFAFNTAAVLGFGSVLMTFIGVNYYFTKGLHSYGAGDTPVFPVWAWLMILCLLLLMVFAYIKSVALNPENPNRRTS